MCLKLIMRNRWSGKNFWQLLFFLQFSLVCSFPLTGKYCWRPYSLKDWAGENCKRKYFSFFRAVVMGIKPLSQQEYVMQITKKKVLLIALSNISYGWIASWEKILLKNTEFLDSHGSYALLQAGQPTSVGSNSSCEMTAVAMFWICKVCFIETGDILYCLYLQASMEEAE